MLDGENKPFSIKLTMMKQGLFVVALSVAAMNVADASLGAISEIVGGGGVDDDRYCLWDRMADGCVVRVVCLGEIWEIFCYSSSHPTSPPSPTCRLCDKQNNQAFCDYDGGDCCGSNVVMGLCMYCLCEDPSYNTCEFLQYQGDG
jgi:hypothetical protein